MSKTTLSKIMKDIGLNEGSDSDSESKSKSQSDEEWEDNDSDTPVQSSKKASKKTTQKTDQKTSKKTSLKKTKSREFTESEKSEEPDESQTSQSQDSQASHGSQTSQGSQASQGSVDEKPTKTKTKSKKALGSIVKNMLKPTKTTASTGEPKEGRGPGRPRKNPVMEPLPKVGVVNKPISNKNKMEMQYGNPHSIRKIFMLLKSMGCQKVFITFEKTNFIIRAEDHLQKSDITIECRGKHMNRYYCANRYTIQLEHEVLASLFAQMANNTHAIRFISRKKEGEDVNIHVVYTDRIMDVDSTYDVPVIGTSEPPSRKWSNPDKYPISFTFDSKYFRTLIKNMETSKADKFIIQKSGDDDFRITHSRSSKPTSIGCNYRYRSAKKIKLESKLSKGEVFTVPIDVRYVKKFAQSLISNQIEIRADSKEPTVFIAEIDVDPETKEPAFKVMIRTKTFEYKPLTKE